MILLILILKYISRGFSLIGSSYIYIYIALNEIKLKIYKLMSRWELKITSTLEFRPIYGLCLDGWGFFLYKFLMF